MKKAVRWACGTCRTELRKEGKRKVSRSCPACGGVVRWFFSEGLLSPRQQEVVDLVARGKTMGEIGQLLGFTSYASSVYYREAANRLGCGGARASALIGVAVALGVVDGQALLDYWRVPEPLRRRGDGVS